MTCDCRNGLAAPSAECTDSLSAGAVGGIIMGVLGFVAGVVAIAIGVRMCRRMNERRGRGQNDTGLAVVGRGGDRSARDFGTEFDDGAFLGTALKSHFHRLSVAEAKQVLTGGPPGSFVITPKSIDVDAHGRVYAVDLNVVYVCPKRLDIHRVYVTHHVVDNSYAVVNADTGTGRTFSSMDKLLRRMGLNCDNSTIGDQQPTPISCTQWASGGTLSGADADLGHYRTTAPGTMSRTTSHYQALTAAEVGEGAAP